MTKDAADFLRGEGATLVGWRLTQLPKSQALEFLLVSPVQPQRLFLLEAAVGLGRLGLITLAGLPVLGLLIFQGGLAVPDVPALIVMPLTWGAITGIGLTMWAYEPRLVRRWGEGAEGPRRKYYELTGAGRQALRLAKAQWADLRALLDALLEGTA